MSPEDDQQWLAMVRALRAGQVPPGIDPQSSEGKRYAILAANVKADLDAAPPMSASQKRTVIALLRGGAHRDG